MLRPLLRSPFERDDDIAPLPARDVVWKRHHVGHGIESHELGMQPLESIVIDKCQGYVPSRLRRARCQDVTTKTIEGVDAQFRRGRIGNVLERQIESRFVRRGGPIWSVHRHDPARSVFTAELSRFPSARPAARCMRIDITLLMSFGFAAPVSAITARVSSMISSSVSSTGR